MILVNYFGLTLQLYAFFTELFWIVGKDVGVLGAGLL
jgi:hypothetical protein